jgi:hypothetical protein
MVNDGIVAGMCAFIEFETEHAAAKAIQNVSGITSCDLCRFWSFLSANVLFLPGMVFKGHLLKLNFAHPKTGRGFTRAPLGTCPSRRLE